MPRFHSLQGSCVRVALAFCLFVSQAHAGSMTLLGVGNGGAASYVGPGDVKGGAKNYWGLRAYSAAYAAGLGNAAIVCDTATFSTCSTITVLTNGNFDTATASGSAACATACVVKQLYDQVGTLHFTCASAAACPTLTFNCTHFNSKPCMNFNGSKSMATTAGSDNVQNQPMTMAFAGERTSGTTNQMALSSLSGTVGAGWGAAANRATVYAPTLQNVSGITDNVSHSFVAVINGASSNYTIDGIGNSVSPGTVALSGGTQAMTLGTDFFAEILTGNLVEAGLWPVAFTITAGTGEAALMCHNQFAYWNTSVSC